MEVPWRCHGAVAHARRAPRGRARASGAWRCGGYHVHVHVGGGVGVGAWAWVSEGASVDDVMCDSRGHKCGCVGAMR